jgi:hypothetical protein
MRNHGDRELWRWRPDRENRSAQNVGKVVEIVRDTARRVGDSIGAGETTLVLGGDCTVGIGTVAGHVSAAERVGLIYFDTHADLNVFDQALRALDRLLAPPCPAGLTITELLWNRLAENCGPSEKNRPPIDHDEMTASAARRNGRRTCLGTLGRCGVSRIRP